MWRCCRAAGGGWVPVMLPSVGWHDAVWLALYHTAHAWVVSACGIWACSRTALAARVGVQLQATRCVCGRAPRSHGTLRWAVLWVRAGRERQQAAPARVCTSCKWRRSSCSGPAATAGAGGEGKRLLSATLPRLNNQLQMGGALATLAQRGQPKAQDGRRRRLRFPRSPCLEGSTHSMSTRPAHSLFRLRSRVPVCLCHCARAPLLRRLPAATRTWAHMPSPLVVRTSLQAPFPTPVPAPAPAPAAATANDLIGFDDVSNPQPPAPAAGKDSHTGYGYYEGGGLTFLTLLCPMC